MKNSKQIDNDNPASYYNDNLASYYKGDILQQNQQRINNCLVKMENQQLDVSSYLKLFPAEVISILKKAGQIAVKQNSRILLVGGMVRDLLLARENSDIDFLLEGDPETFLLQLAEELEGEYTYNPQFKTGRIRISSKYNIDLAAARQEYYSHPGALPQVELAGIKEDMMRRDFTINSLALGVRPEDWGKLFDPFQARQDIEDKKLKVLHSFSFFDDPTRIIRGIRLAVKLGFAFEKTTLELMQEALNWNKFFQLSPARVLKELQFLLGRKTDDHFLNILADLPVFKLLNINFKMTEKIAAQLEVLEGFLEYFKEKNYNIEDWLVRLKIILQYSSLDNIANWQLTSLAEKFLSFSADQLELSRLSQQEIDPVELVALLEDLTLEELILLMVTRDNRIVRKNVLYYLEVLAKIELHIDGHLLQELGLKPGPAIRRVLDQLKKARLRGKVRTLKEEKKLALQLINELK